MIENNQQSALTIFKPANMEQIVALGPTAFERNAESRERCIAFGQSLLERIDREGMTDALDQEIASYINRARITLGNMNNRRAPVTKLFDEIRSVFTSLEADVDPKKSASVPGQLQGHRDRYAARKRAEAEARRQEEMRRQAAEAARLRYRTELTEDYKASLNALIVSRLNRLAALDSSLTLDNCTQISESIMAIPVTLDTNAFFKAYPSGVRIPAELPLEESRAILDEVRRDIAPRLCEQYQFEVESTRDEIRDRMPSKIVELEAIAKANAEEAARLKAAMEERDRAEAAEKERQRLEREAAEKAQAELAAAQAEMTGLFDTARLQKAEYQPKTAVKKRIVALAPNAYMAIVGYWWSKEGQHLSVEELGKIFKRMVTFCEKAANDKDRPEFLQDASIVYEDEVKAK